MNDVHLAMTPERAFEKGGIRAGRGSWEDELPRLFNRRRNCLFVLQFPLHGASKRVSVVRFAALEGLMFIPAVPKSRQRRYRELSVVVGSDSCDDSSLDSTGMG